MTLKLSMVLCIKLVYCVWPNGWTSVSDTEFLVERWYQYCRVIEADVKVNLQWSS
jgi:hypothetical protein